MLQKKKSKAVWQLKYVLLFPLVLGMLVYTSCESDLQNKHGNSNGEENEIMSSAFTKISQLTEKYNELIVQRNAILENYNEDDASKIKQLNNGMKEIQDQMYQQFAVLDNEINRLPLEKRLSLIGEEIENKDSLSEQEKQQVLKIAENLANKINKEAKPVNGWTVKAGVGNLPEVKDQETSDSYPFATIDEIPVFPGCENATDPKECFAEKLVEHIKKNFRYPEAAQEQGIQGRVSVVFTIDVNGNVSSIKKRGPHELLENEAVRIIERLPKMQPGKHEGKVMNVPYAIPITFRLKNQPEGTTANGSKDYLLVDGMKVKKRGKTYFEGVVTDKESMGLSGVVVSIEGKEAGVMSNFNGAFSIAVEEDDVVKFQYEGLPDKRLDVSQY